MLLGVLQNYVWFIRESPLQEETEEKLTQHQRVDILNAACFVHYFR